MKIADKIISTQRPAFVMGIVNATPDSFFEKSRGGLDLALKLIDDGADILDLGGESTRPGYVPVSEEEEIARIIPLIKQIRRYSQIPVSVDTTKLSVFKAAAEYGAQIWNDVKALSNSTENAKYVAENKISVILMHNGEGDIRKVNADLFDIIKFCRKNGIEKEKIIVDPGIGFGKTNEQSIALIKNAEKICKQKYPVLMALSRKRCVGEMTGRPAEERLAGTIAANLISVQRGAKIIRAHDVAETVDMLNVLAALSK